MRMRSATTTKANGVLPHGAYVADEWTMPAGLDGRAHVAVDLLTDAARPPDFVRE